jgi:hypothetical protein
LLAIVIVSLSSLIVAQARPSDRLFEKMALQKGVTMLSFPAEMLDAVNLNLRDDDGESTGQKVSGDLQEVKVVIYKAPKAQSNFDFRSEVLKYLPENKFKIVEPDDHDIETEDGSCDIRVFKKGTRIKECHVLFLGEVNGVLLSFFGDFKQEDVKEMAEKVDHYKE